MASASSFFLRLHSYSTKTCLLIVDSSWAAGNINTALLLHIINSQEVRGFSLNAVFCNTLELCSISSRCMNHRNYLRLSYIFSSSTVWKLKLESHLTWIERSSEHSDVLLIKTCGQCLFEYDCMLWARFTLCKYTGQSFVSKLLFWDISMRSPWFFFLWTWTFWQEARGQQILPVNESSHSHLFHRLTDP